MYVYYVGMLDSSVSICMCRYFYMHFVYLLVANDIIRRATTLDYRLCETGTGGVAVV